ncbi:MAG TPA: lysophospholipid acyltransferase family protein [Coleofasciculaceae cyanobacterium]|jgi:1-acyl-sn-glycerol-3-phosphate acyltransferase
MNPSFEIPFPILKTISEGVLASLFQFEVRGRHHVEKLDGRLLLAGNHTGLLDSLAVIAAFRRNFRFIMTEEVFTWGLIGKIVRYGNIIPLYKGKAKRAMQEVIERLRRDEAICIFPEGKLTEDGSLAAFNEGVAYLHGKSDAPIVPFVIHGGFEAWPIGRRFPRPRKIILEFGEPVLPGHPLSRRELTRLLQERVEAMKNKRHHNLSTGETIQNSNSDEKPPEVQAKSKFSTHYPVNAAPSSKAI